MIILNASLCKKIEGVMSEAGPPASEKFTKIYRMWRSNPSGSTMFPLKHWVQFYRKV